MSAWPLRVLVYGAGDAIDGTNALAPQIAKQLSDLGTIATNRYIAAIAQLDATSVPTQRYVLDPAGRQPIYSYPDIDTGDPGALVDFASWAAQVCPAQRSVVVLSGHGAAWQDAAADQALGLDPTRGLGGAPVSVVHHPRNLFGGPPKMTPPTAPGGAQTRAILVDGTSRDYLSNAELGAACEQIAQQFGAPIDVLVLDACLMSSWEVLQELAAAATTVVAAIDEISASGIDLSRPVATLGKSGGAADARTVARTIATQFQPAAAFDSCIAFDLSAAAWQAALAAFRSACASLLRWVQAASANAVALRGALATAAASVVEYTDGGLADVGALVGALAALPGVPADAVTSARAALAAIQQCELGRATGADYAAATGLSIFAPSTLAKYTANRAEYVRLQFPVLTGWGAVLDALYGFASRGVAPSTGAATTGTGATGAATTGAGATGAGVSGDAEFVVSLPGFPADDGLRARIQAAIQRVVLDALAALDALDGIQLQSPQSFAATRALRLPTHTTGLVAVDAGAETIALTRGVPSAVASVPAVAAAAAAATMVPATSDMEFRVALPGIPLTAAQIASLDAQIRSAVLQEVAATDLGAGIVGSAPGGATQTRSLISSVGRIILGLILRPTDVSPLEV